MLEKYLRFSKNISWDVVIIFYIFGLEKKLLHSFDFSQISKHIMNIDMVVFRYKRGAPIYEAPLVTGNKFVIATLMCSSGNESL